MQQEARPLIINIQEGLQIGEFVGFARLCNRLVRQPDVVSFGQRKHHFRLEGALDVQMQLSLGDTMDKIIQRCRPPL